MNKTSKTFWLAISLTGALLCPLVASAEANGEHPSEVNANRASSQQKDRVSGAVIDAATGEPIIGATIVEDGTSNATITDYSGNFSLNVAQGATVTISFIGFKSQTITAGTDLKISLEEESVQLEDLVVIGYGTARKKDLTGSVVQIRPENLVNESPSTVQDLLRTTAGLNVGISNDAKGGGSLNIRGQRSVYSGGGHNDPLIILDGMQFYGELSEINPDNIAQIDILKDASSAAVYGAKAANGVIIVTTKKGKTGEPRVSLSANFGFTTRSDYEEYFSTDDYIQHKVDYFERQTYGLNEEGVYTAYAKGETRNGYYRNPNNLPAGVSLDEWRGYTTNGDQSDEEIWLRRINFKGNVLQNALDGKTIDWDDYVFRTGFQQDYNVNIGGATEKANYFLSAGYLKNEGVKKGNDYETVRVGIKVNMDVKSWLSVGATANFQNRTDGNNYDPGEMVAYCPFADDKDENGEWLQFIFDDSEYTQRPTSPYYNAQYTELEKGFTVLNTQFNAKLNLPFGFTYQFNVSPRYEWFYDRYFMSADLPESNPANRGVNREQAKRFDWSLNNIVTWQRNFADVHDVTVTLVQEAEERRYWRDRIEARHILPTDALGFHSVTGATKEESSFNVNDTHETADAMLARLQYTYDDRYLLTASVRRDGYCAFGANYPHATFPALALGWTFTNEEFWNANDIMNNGKLRFSVGKNGNRSLADPYLALSNLTTGQFVQYYYENQVHDLTYLRVDRLGNPNLKWEKSTAYDIGLDYSFLAGRISGTFDWYLTQTKDMIMDQRLPGFAGFDHITTNLGQVDNRGVELSINTINIDRPRFKWNTSVSFTYNKNKIKKLYGDKDEDGNELDDRTNGWFIGKSIDEIWDYEITGIWQIDEAEEAARYGQEPGDPKIKNNPDNDIVNEDGTITPYYDDEDKVFLGKRTAPARLSIRNEFTIFKNFSVGVSMYGMFGWKASKNQFNYDQFMNRDNDGGFLLYRMSNQLDKDYWTIDNPSSKYARIDAQGTSGADHPHKYYNRSFMRLDNISLAYNFKSSLCERLFISSMKVYGNIKNVCNVHSKNWTYGDPENMSYSTRTFNLGLNVTF